MEYNTEKLRTLQNEEYRNIRDSKVFTLILIDENKSLHYAVNRGEKDDLYEKYVNNKKDSCIMCAWTGKYSTDIFNLDEYDLTKDFYAY